VYCTIVAKGLKLCAKEASLAKNIVPILEGKCDLSPSFERHQETLYRETLQGDILAVQDLFVIRLHCLLLSRRNVAFPSKIMLIFFAIQAMISAKRKLDKLLYYCKTVNNKKTITKSILALFPNYASFCST
jgi:hypothetical protein